MFFKASVPSGMCNYDDTLPYENEDKQLWDPTRLSEEVTREYLAKSAETTGAAGIAGVNGIPTGSHIRDDEQVGEKRKRSGGEVLEIDFRIFLFFSKLSESGSGSVCGYLDSELLVGCAG